MGTSAFGYINYFLTGTISADSAEYALPPGNLALDHVNEAVAWQTPDGVVTAAGGASLRCTAPASSQLFRGAGLFGSNLTSRAVITVSLHIGLSTTVVSFSMAGPNEGYGQALIVFDQDYTADYVQIDIDDPTNPDNHINIGGAFAGPLWLPASGMTWDSTRGVLPSFQETLTFGGQLFRSQKFRKRTALPKFDAIRDAETVDYLDEMLRVADMGHNVLFIPDVTSVNLYSEAIFGTLEATTYEISYPAKTVDRRSWSRQIVERK